MRELKRRTLSLVLALMMAGTALTPAFAQEQTGEESGKTDTILPPPGIVSDVSDETEEPSSPSLPGNDAGEGESGVSTPGGEGGQTDPGPEEKNPAENGPDGEPPAGSDPAPEGGDGEFVHAPGCTLPADHEGECGQQPPAETEAADCTLTEGCTLEAGHEGECVLAAAPLMVPRDGEVTVTGFEGLEQAVQAAGNDPTTIVIGADIDLTDTITIGDGQDITLVDDGEARTIYVKTKESQRSMYYGAFYIQNGGTFTLATSETGRNDLLVVDGTDAKDGYIGPYYDKSDFYGDIISCRGTFVMNGGTIRNTACQKYWGGVIIISGKDGPAEFHLNDGEISDNHFVEQNGGIVKVDAGAKFFMAGGEISNNSSEGDLYNAPVYVASCGNSHFEMTGGAISNNEGFYSGGVFIGEGAYPDFQSIATMEMKGGEITGNTAKQYGGGIMVCGAAEVVLKDGSISGNEALIGGGIAVYDLYHAMGVGQDFSAWKHYFPAGFVMNDGDIADNEARLGQNIQNQGDGGCGGGIYVASDNVVLNGGTISGNTAERQGGGVYVGSTPYTLCMYDTLITGNTASILGGGLWFCPTGDATAAVTNGAAIFGNETISRGTDNAGDDFVAVPREGRQHYITLADRMLGGGEVCWYRDGGVLHGATVGGNVLGEPDPAVGRYDPNSPSERITNIEMHEEGIALKAVTSEAAEELARSRAKLLITGNNAPRGGGVGSNGAVVIGTPEDEWSLRVTKAWDGVPAGDQRPVTIRLKIGGYELDTVTLNVDNGWTEEFTQLPNPDTLGELTITVIEEGDEYEASYSELTVAGEKLLTVTVTNKPDTPPDRPDEPDYPDLTLTKVDEGGEVIIRPASFIVYKKSGGETLYKTVSGRWTGDRDEAWTYYTRDGRFTVYDLKPGTYYIEEIKAPDGYQKAEEPLKVTVEDWDVKAEFVNRPSDSPDEPKCIPDTGR